MKHPRHLRTGGDRYPVGSRWIVKETKWLRKNEIVEIIDDGTHGKHREVMVSNGKLQGWIPVKKLKKRIFPRRPIPPKPAKASHP